MKYLLDTCVISELTKIRPRKNVIKWIASIEESFLYLSVLTIGEILKGITMLRDSKKKAALQDWVHADLLNRFENRILPISVRIATTWGEIQGKAEQDGRTLPAIDSLIAATAIVHDLTVVTRDTGHMKNTGAMIYNPWNSS